MAISPSASADGFGDFELPSALLTLNRSTRRRPGPRARRMSGRIGADLRASPRAVRQLPGRSVTDRHAMLRPRPGPATPLPISADDRIVEDVAWTGRVPRLRSRWLVSHAEATPDFVIAADRARNTAFRLRLQMPGEPSADAPASPRAPASARSERNEALARPLRPRSPPKSVRDVPSWLDPTDAEVADLLAKKVRRSRQHCARPRRDRCVPATEPKASPLRVADGKRGARDDERVRGRRQGSCRPP